MADSHFKDKVTLSNEHTCIAAGYVISSGWMPISKSTLPLNKNAVPPARARPRETRPLKKKGCDQAKDGLPNRASIPYQCAMYLYQVGEANCFLQTRPYAGTHRCTKQACGIVGPLFGEPSYTVAESVRTAGADEVA